MTSEKSISKIAIFNGKQIRKVFHKNEWYFSIVDICYVLTESADPGAYWRKLKQRLSTEGSQVVTFCHGLKLVASDGKKYLTDCANTESVFRIIQSIPSPKAEPFKKWLSKLGYERIQEIENPELAMKRSRDIYIAKGYPKDWIEKRMRGIAIREKLTNEWENRGIQHQKEFAILTAEISQATFGLKPSEHKKLKRLTKENLRDHMTDLELIFTMLGEASTTEIAVQKNAYGFQENKEAAHAGGTVAGNARRELEKKSGRKVVSKKNFLHNQLPE